MRRLFAIILLSFCAIYGKDGRLPDEIKPDDLYTDFLLDNIKSSSELKDKIKYRYAPWRMIDGKDDTAWAEGKEDEGIGEYVDLYSLFLNRDYVPSYMEIFIGFAKNEKLFKENNRPKEILITIQHRTIPEVIDSYNVLLSDKREYQRIYFLNLSDIIKKEYIEKNYSTEDLMIRITIKSVYKGTKYNDTCISEIKIYYPDGKEIFSVGMKNRGEKTVGGDPFGEGRKK